MNRQLSPIVLLVFIVSFFLLPFFHTGIFITHDGEAHVERIGSYAKVLREINIPVRWASDLNYGYGSPLFIFFYPLPYLIGSFFYLVGFSLEFTFKLIVGLSFVAAPVCFFLWSNTLFKKHVAFIASIFYGLAPYHLLDLYVRGDIGEMLGFVFIPLVFFAVEKYLDKEQFKYIFWGGVFFDLLIISHQGLALMFFPVIIGYVLFKAHTSISKVLRTYSILIVGLLLSCFFWLPFLVESRFIASDILFGEMYKSHFSKLAKLIYSPWGFGPNINEIGGLSPQIGPVLVFAVFGAAILLNRLKKNVNLVIFWLIVLIGSIFFSLSLSSFMYEHFVMLKRLQFPWRFIALSSFASTVLLGYFMNVINKKTIIIVIVVFFISVIPTAKLKGYIHFQDEYYLNFPGTTFHHAEATTIWTDGDPSRFPKSNIEIIQGYGEVESYSKKSQIHELKINAKTQIKVLDNTIYFPGWRVFIDGQKTPIEFQDINHRGLITFSVPKGMHNIEVIFKESAVRLFSNVVSLFSIVGIFSIFVVRMCFSFVKKR